MTRFETRFFLAVMPAVTLITLAGWANADSGIVKGPGLNLGSKAKDRSCQIVERVNPQTGKVERKMVCGKR